MHPARVRRLTATLVGCAIMAWLLTGDMHGAIFRMYIAQPVGTATTTSAIVTSQCQALPAPSPSPADTTSDGSSASPTSAASSTPPDLCVSVEAAQSSIKPGQTATWTVRVWSQNGSAPGTAVSLSTTPSGLPVSFTSGCPTGDGNSTCVTGDLGTSVTPNEYQMQAQVLVPGWETSLGSVTLSVAANANTNPAMTVIPVAGQVITVIDPTPSPTPSRTQTSTRASTTTRTTAPPNSAPAPATTPAVSVPAIGPMPSITVAAPSTLVPNTSTDLPMPEIAPISATTGIAPTPATGGVATSSAANIQPLGVSSSPANDLTLTVHMSAATVQALGMIVLGLAFILAITKLVADSTRRSRHPAPKKDPSPKPANRKPFKFPRLKRPHWPGRRPSGVPRQAPLTPSAQGTDADAPA